MISVERYTGKPKALGINVVMGILGLVLTGVGFAMDPKATAHSYLFAFCYWVGISVASLIMVAIFHTAKAKWTTVLRRAMETMAIAVPIFFVLGLVLVPFLKHLYPWLRPEEELLKTISAVEVGHLKHKQHGYLNVPFFVVRQFIYFGVWTFVSHRLHSWSTRQDETGDLALTVKARMFSPGSLPFLALTITFASFDWLMSLTPLWQSTMFGVYYFAGSFLAAFCVLTIATVEAQGNKDLYGNLVTPAHFHNLGKLMLAFTAFWAYIAFSQFMLIWIANLPEEAPWYHVRLNGGWRNVSIALFFIHFVIPFGILLSRNLKLQPRKLAVVAFYLLIVHAVDLYWLVWPAHNEGGPSFHWTLLTSFIGVGGIAISFALWRAGGKYTVPVKDPYIADSLRYVQP
jgi:hypothetical protein